MIVFEILDKNKRRIHLTDERYRHITEHPGMQNRLDYIKETLEKPLKTIRCGINGDIVYYYKYYKNIKLKTKYLMVIVKYLNDEGFIISAYLVNKIK